MVPPGLHRPDGSDPLMLSRSAESLYWLSRYVERGENIARFIDVNLHLNLDVTVSVGDHWEPLVRITGDWDTFVERYTRATRENVIEFLTFDRAYPNSILSCLERARECARGQRQIISSEMWEHVNRTYLMVRSATREQVQQFPHDFYNSVKNASHAFVGITTATMSHGEAWQFSQLGRMIERADKTSRILDVKYYILLPQVQDVGTPFDHVKWSALLRSVSAF